MLEQTIYLILVTVFIFLRLHLRSNYNGFR